MPLMYQAQSLQMEWCLACHRDPVKNIRPKEEVTNVAWKPPADPRARGAAARARRALQRAVEDQLLDLSSLNCTESDST